MLFTKYLFVLAATVPVFVSVLLHLVNDELDDHENYKSISVSVTAYLFDPFTSLVSSVK